MATFPPTEFSEKPSSNVRSCNRTEEPRMFMLLLLPALRIMQVRVVDSPKQQIVISDRAMFTAACVTMGSVPAQTAIVSPPVEEATAASSPTTVSTQGPVVGEQDRVACGRTGATDGTPVGTLVVVTTGVTTTTGAAVGSSVWEKLGGGEGSTGITNTGAIGACVAVGCVTSGLGGNVTGVVVGLCVPWTTGAKVMVTVGESKVSALGALDIDVLNERRPFFFDFLVLLCFLELLLCFGLFEVLYPPLLPCFRAFFLSL